MILGLNDPEEQFLLYDALIMVWLKLLHRTRCMKHGALKRRLDTGILFHVLVYEADFLASYSRSFGACAMQYTGIKRSDIFGTRFPMVLELAHW